MTPSEFGYVREDPEDELFTKLYEEPFIGRLYSWKGRWVAFLDAGEQFDEQIIYPEHWTGDWPDVASAVAAIETSIAARVEATAIPRYPGSYVPIPQVENE
jgi:hypothetical protein